MRTRDALLRRASAHRSALASVFVTVLLTLTVATTVALLDHVARDTAVSGVLGRATAAERVVRVEADLESGADLTRLDRTVRTALDDALAPATPTVQGRAVSGSYSMPGGAEQPDLVVFASYDGLTDRLELVEGSWPADVPGPVTVALPQPAADALGLAVGERWTVRSRLTGTPVRVELVGLFAPPDPADAAHVGDGLLVRGVERGSFTTYGPLVVTRSTFDRRFADEATATWVADPDLAVLGPGDVQQLEQAVRELAAGADAELRVDTDLDEVLDRVATPLTATTAVVAVAAVPLVLLAGLSLLTAARLVRDHRRQELSLLRARGASAAQLGALGAAEAIALVVPAVLLAPWAASLLVRLTGSSGPTAVGATGLPPPSLAWAVAALSGVVAAAVLMVPIARSKDLTAASRSADGDRGVAARRGADVLVLAAAALSAWQLSRYDGPVRAAAQGVLEVDPLLVVAPALLVLAGCVLALRLLPAVVAATQPLVNRSRGLTTALATWTVGRRLGRQVGPVLTVLLAAAVVAFSLTWLATWRQSTQDQARFATGADLQVRGETSHLDRAAMVALPGADAVTPVVRTSSSFGDARGEILAVDPATAGDVVTLRGDLAVTPLPRLLAALADTPAGDAGVPLPDGTRAVGLGAFGSLPGPTSAWQVVVQDAGGVVHAVPLASVDNPADVRADMQGLQGMPQPLALLGLRGRAGGLGPRDARELAASGGPALRAVSEEGTTSGVALPPGGSWRAGVPTPGTVTLSASSGAAAASVPAVVTEGLAETVGDQDLVVDDDGLSLRLEVVGVVSGVPSVVTGAPGVLVDLGALARTAFRQTGQVTPPAHEWWVDVDGDTSAAAEALQTGAPEGADLLVLEQDEQLEALRSGPVGTALVGVLAVALVAAVLAAASGFAAATSALARSRRAEAAVLRALGSRPQQVARLQAVDRAALLSAAAVTGIAVGLAVAWWTTPLITLTDAATTPFPRLELVVPWTALALVGLAVVVVLVVPATTSGRRGQGPVREEQL